MAAANSTAEVEDARTRSLGTLSKNPRCLHTLWLEYEHGIGGRKPTKLFTKTEKGRDRFTYSNRLVFWSKIAEMVCAGWQSTQAINKVLNHYGTNLSVTKIIQAMRKDRNSDDGYPAELSQIPT